MMPTSAQRDRVVAAIAQMTNAEINAAIAELGDGEHLTNLAQILNVKKPALRSHPDPALLVRARIRSGGPGRAIVAALEIAGPCSDACIDDLGDERADDPTKEDMLEVLPPLVAEFGEKLVTLMLSGYPAMDAPCADVFDELLDTDERFAIGAPSDDAAATPIETVVLGSAAPDTTEQAAKRQRRKEADAKKKEQAARQRAAVAASEAAYRAARKKKR